MSDFGFQPTPAPVVPPSLGEGFSALDAPQPVETAQPLGRFISSPVPPVPEQVFTPDQLSDNPLVAGFGADYASRLPGGLSDAKRHMTSVQMLHDEGKLDPAVSKLWAKLNSAPGR